MRPLVLLCAFAACAWAEPQPLTLRFEGAPARDALALAAREAGLPLVLAPDVEGALSLEAGPLAPEEALAAVAQAAGLRLTVVDGVWIAHREALVPGDPSDAADGPGVDLVAVDCPADAWLRLLAAPDADLVVGGAVDRGLSLVLRGVAPGAALRASVRAWGGVAEARARGWRVRLPAASPLDPLERALRARAPADLGLRLGALRAGLAPPPNAPDPAAILARVRGAGPAPHAPERESLRRACVEAERLQLPGRDAALGQLLERLAPPLRAQLVEEWVAAALEASAELEVASEVVAADRLFAEVAVAVAVAWQVEDPPQRARLDSISRAAQERWELITRRDYAARRGLTLHATRVGEDGARCVLDGRVLAVGDPVPDRGGGAVPGLHLTRIGHGWVELQLDDSIWTVGVGR